MKEVRTLGPGEAGNYPRYEGPGESTHTTTVTTRIYDEDLLDLDEIPETITQVIPAPKSLCAVFEEGGKYWLEPVEHLVVIGNSALFGLVGVSPEDVDPSTDTIDEAEGFKGYVVVSSPAESLGSEQVKQLLEETKIEEDD